MAGTIGTALRTEEGVEMTIGRIVATATRDRPLPEQKRTLLDLLDRVEQRLRQLRARLLSVASVSSDTCVQQLIALMREDEHSIMEYCIHRCDREDPILSVEHDLTNNEHSLSLQEHLAAAKRFGVSPRRVLFLHRLQREICQALKERGIDVSQN